MDTSALAVVITYGHSVTDLRSALQPAIELQADGYPIRAIAIDDASGNAPRLDEVECFVTPSNSGYCAAVNFVASNLASGEERIVFINPDAKLDREALRSLAWPEHVFPIIVPRIIAGLSLENVRSIYTVRHALLQIVAGRLASQSLMDSKSEDSSFILGAPWIPTGTIASFSTQFLRQNPLREQMFWIEMSALALDTPGQVRVGIDHHTAEHEGHSSSKHASAIVSASLLNARASFVRQYGSRFQTALLPGCVASGIALKLLQRRCSPSQAAKMWSISKGATSWQSIKAVS